MGYRLGMNDFGMAFQHFSVLKQPVGKALVFGGVGLAIVAGGLGVLGAHKGAGLLSLLLGLMAAGVIWFGPVSMGKQAAMVPMIHDITTDTDNPPAFVAVLPLREGAKNPPEYDTSQTADQVKAYPDLQTLVVMDRSYDEVFAAAQASLQAMKLNIVAADKEDGRLEAVWTSTVFRFKDDVVVRIAPGEGGVLLVDVRSKSRVGKSDLGMNAKRIRTFLTEMRTRLSLD